MRADRNRTARSFRLFSRPDPLIQTERRLLCGCDSRHAVMTSGDKEVTFERTASESLEEFRTRVTGARPRDGRMWTIFLTGSFGKSFRIDCLKFLRAHLAKIQPSLRNGAVKKLGLGRLAKQWSRPILRRNKNRCAGSSSLLYSCTARFCRLVFNRSAVTRRGSIGLALIRQQWAAFHRHDVAGATQGRRECSQTILY